MELPSCRLSSCGNRKLWKGGKVVGEERTRSVAWRARSRVDDVGKDGPAIVLACSMIRFLMLDELLGAMIYSPNDDDDM